MSLIVVRGPVRVEAQEASRLLATGGWKKSDPGDLQYTVRTTMQATLIENAAKTKS